MLRVCGTVLRKDVRVHDNILCVCFICHDRRLPSTSPCLRVQEHFGYRSGLSMFFVLSQASTVLGVPPDQQIIDETGGHAGQKQLAGRVAQLRIERHTLVCSHPRFMGPSLKETPRDEETIFLKEWYPTDSNTRGGYQTFSRTPHNNSK